MNVKVQYLGPIRTALNKREDEIEVSPKTTVYDLLKRLSQTYGKLFESEIFEENGKNIREELVITVNGKAIGQLEGAQTALKKEDVVTLLPLFAGGG